MNLKYLYEYDFVVDQQPYMKYTTHAYDPNQSDRAWSLSFY